MSRTIAALSNWFLMLTVAVGLTACGKDDRTHIAGGTYMAVEQCGGSGCTLVPAVGTLTLEIRLGDEQVDFTLPDNTVVTAGFTVAPRQDWPEDCYTVSDGKVPMEALIIDGPIELLGLRFEHPVLVRQCSSRDPAYLTLTDAELPPYQWFCSGDKCLAFRR